jgi:hypothetical protein
MNRMSRIYSPTISPVLLHPRPMGTEAVLGRGCGFDRQSVTRRGF